jgi:hypothetical protein
MPKSIGLRVGLHVVERELIEGRGGRRLEREGAENGGAGLAARAAGAVADHAPAEAEGVVPARPGHGVRELELVAEDVGEPRLADRERHRARARVRGREIVGLPEGDRIAVQVGDPRLVEEIGLSTAVWLSWLVQDRREYLRATLGALVPPTASWGLSS